MDRGPRPSDSPGTVLALEKISFENPQQNVTLDLPFSLRKPGLALEDFA